MARSTTIKINDASTETGYPGVWVTITENANGSLAFILTQDGGVIGDLRGFFFDIANESLLGSLSVNTANKFVQGNDNVKDLGGGATMSGLLGSDGGYDAGIEIGTSGIGKDDVRSFAFTLSSSMRGLTLDDFANVDLGVRLTSVGTLGSSRSGSSKILETTSTAVNAVDDNTGCVDENSSSNGNVLSNDTNAGYAQVTWTGQSTGNPIAIGGNGLQLATITLASNGGWVVNANGADVDKLSAGEHITITPAFAYTVKAVDANDSTSWSEDTATLTVRICGVNDAPVALDDDVGCVDEDATLSSSVAGNDSDIDRLDTHTYSIVDGSFDGQGKLVFNDDGTFYFDPEGNYDDLVDGESVELSFQYTITDNNGATDTATVTFCVDGQGELPPPPPPPPPSADYFPAWAQDISHITLVFEKTAGDVSHGGGPNYVAADGYYTVKVDAWDAPGLARDVDDVLQDILTALDANSNIAIDADTDLLGVIIKGGIQTTGYFAYASDTNGTAVDILPVGIALYLPGGSANEGGTNQIDAVVTYASLGI